MPETRTCPGETLVPLTKLYGEELLSHGSDLQKQSGFEIDSETSEVARACCSPNGFPQGQRVHTQKAAVLGQRGLNG